MLRRSLWLGLILAVIFAANGVYSAGFSSPSYHQGFARSASESAHPRQWKGLIGAWIPALGPTGNTLFDWSGFGNDGTLTDMAPATDWVIGANPRSPGYALDFDGSDDLVNMGNIAIWNGLTAASWVLWVTPSGIEDDTFLGKWVDGSSTTFLFDFNDDPGGEATLFIAQSSTSLGQASADIPTGTLIDNQWHHLAIIFEGSGAEDSDRLKLFVDGVQITLSFGGSEPIPASLFTSTADFEIGSNTGLSRFYIGQIAEVRAYNRALRANEIVQDYAVSLGTFRKRLSLVAKVPVVPTVSWPSSATWPIGGNWGATGWGSTAW